MYYIATSREKAVLQPVGYVLQKNNTMRALPWFFVLAVREIEITFYGKQARDYANRTIIDIIGYEHPEKHIKTFSKISAENLKKHLQKYNALDGHMCINPEPISNTYFLVDPSDIFDNAQEAQEKVAENIVRAMPYITQINISEIPVLKPIPSKYRAPNKYMTFAGTAFVPV